VASFAYFNGTGGPGLRYSVDLRMQTHTEPVPLKYGKLSAKHPCIYGYFLQGTSDGGADLPSRDAFT